MLVHLTAHKNTKHILFKWIDQYNAKPFDCLALISILLYLIIPDVVQGFIPCTDVKSKLIGIPGYKYIISALKVNI